MNGLNQEKIAPYLIDIGILIFVVIELALTYNFVTIKWLQYLIMLLCILIAIAVIAAEVVFYVRNKPVGAIVAEAPKKTVAALVLLGEDQRDIMQWDLTGKISVLIGKNDSEQQVDIDLLETEYGSMIDTNHCLLNFTGTDWYVEDLSTRNGTGIIRPGSERIQYLAPGVPCKIQVNDILCVANDTKLSVQ